MYFILYYLSSDDMLVFRQILKDSTVYSNENYMTKEIVTKTIQI